MAANPAAPRGPPIDLTQELEDMMDECEAELAAEAHHKRARLLR